MLTKEQVLEFLSTDTGKSFKKELITDYIQNDEGGKALLEEIMQPEITKARDQAINDWETNGKGKGLKEHNEKLLSQIKELKGYSEDGKKIKNLLDISGKEDYNSLEDLLFALKKGDISADEEMVKLRKEANSYRIKARDLGAKLPSIEKEKEDLETALKESDSYISNLLINQSIKGALLNQGFDDFQASALVHRVAEQGKFHVENSEQGRRAVNDQGLTPEDFTVKTYLSSEEGKAFKPNRATGGGATGGPGGAAGSGKKLSDLTWTERAKMMSEDPDGYKRLKETSQN